MYIHIYKQICKYVRVIRTKYTHTFKHIRTNMSAPAAQFKSFTDVSCTSKSPIVAFCCKPTSASHSRAFSASTTAFSSRVTVSVSSRISFLFFAPSISAAPPSVRARKSWITRSSSWMAASTGCVWGVRSRARKISHSKYWELEIYRFSR